MHDQCKVGARCKAKKNEKNEENEANDENEETNKNNDNKKNKKNTNSTSTTNTSKGGGPAAVGEKLDRGEWRRPAHLQLRLPVGF